MKSLNLMTLAAPLPEEGILDAVENFRTGIVTTPKAQNKKGRTWQARPF